MDKLKRDIILYYIFSFCIGFYLANGTTVLFAQELGFSYARIFVLTAIYMLMFILFEIPTGALADLIGRKKTVILGCVTLAVAAILTGVSSTFLQVFLSFFVWALGFSLISGAMEALIYDNVSDKQIITSVFGKSHFYWLIGTATAGILGPYLYSLNFRFPYLFSAVPFFLAGVTILFFAEQPFEKKGFSIRNHFVQSIEGIKIAWRSRFLRWAIGLMSLRFAVAYTFSNAFQPYLQGVGFSVKSFSILLPLMFVVEALGGAGAGRMAKWIGQYKVFIFGILGIGLALGLLGVFALRPLFAVLLVYLFIQGFLSPVLTTYANEHIPSSHRSTVVSVLSMVATTTAALTLFLFGYFTDKLGIDNLFILLGGLVILVGGILLLARPKETGRPSFSSFRGPSSGGGKA